MKRKGMTLVELLLVLALLGLGASVVAVSLERWDRPAAVAPLVEATAQIRLLAVDSARTVTRVVVVDSIPRLITALPDGSVLTSAESVDRFTGRPLRRAK